MDKKINPFSLIIKFFTPKTTLFTILNSLIISGIFCLTVYVFAVTPLYAPGETTNPSCALSNANCTTPAPVIATDLGLWNSKSYPTDAAGFLANNGSGTLSWENISYSKSFTISSPTVTADSPLWRAPSAMTIRAVHLLAIGGTSVAGNVDIYDSNGQNPVPCEASDITSTGTNANDDGTLSNPSVSAGAYVGWHTTSVSGSVTRAIITVEYTMP
jgi:hypothetical protein